MQVPQYAKTNAGFSFLHYKFSGLDIRSHYGL